MATIAIINTLTLASIGWSIWVRRITWTCRWELTVTLGITLDGIGLLLTTVAKPVANRLLHSMIGIWNVSTIFSHICFVSSACLIAYSLLSRLATDDDLHRMFTRWVKRPATLAVIAMMAVFTAGDIGAQAAALTYPTPWVFAYRAIVFATMIYLLGYACVALLTLRRYRRHRVVADLYLVACMCGMVSCLVRLAYLPTMPDRPQFGDLLAVGLSTLWLAGYALTASWSWRRKTQEFRRVRDVVVS